MSERLGPPDDHFAHTMASTQAPIADTPPPRPGGKFSPARLGICLAGACLMGALAAGVADIVQNDFRFAPLLLFPLLTGFLLGMAMIGLVRIGQIGHRPTILLGTLLAVTLAVAGQHYQVYRRAMASPEKFDHAERMRRELDQDHLPRLPGEPETFLEFLQEQAATGRPLAGSLVARDAMAWLSWGIDGLLALLAAMAIVYPVTRLPFCDRCGTWLRTIRSGRIGAQATEALAELAELNLETEPKSGRFRLSSCEGGCIPSNLVLIWEDASGATFTGEASLDSDARNRLMQIADAARSDAARGDAAATNVEDATD